MNGAGPRAGRILGVVVAGAAFVLWAFAEWLIIGLCFGLGESGCGTNEWGGIYLPVQSVLAIVGMAAAAWVVSSGMTHRPIRRPFLWFAGSASLWLLLLAVKTG